MAQDSTYNLPNIDRGAASRAKLNSIFEAVKTQNSGGSEPASPSAFMLWADSATDYLKIRNEANTNWNIIGKLNSEGLVLTSAGNPNGAVTGLYEGQLLFDTTNNIPWYYSGSSTSWFTSNGNSRTVTTTDTALTTDNTILLDATAGAFTETLYTAVGNRGRRLTLIKIDSSANAATIDANASETIAGSLTRILYRQFDAFTIESDNANWNVVNEQGKGRVPIREVVVSSPVATVDFSLPSGYNSFELEWFKFQPATDQVILYLRFSTNNGSSYDSGAANYRYAYILPSIANAQPTDTGLNIAGGHGSVAGNIGNASAEGTSGTIKIYNAGDSATRTTIAGLSTWLDSNSSCQNIFVGGGREATQATTNIRVLFSGGNITAGTIRLWGIQ